MSVIISTDHPLTTSQQALLAALLETLVPASDDGEMPSAAQVDFDTYLRTQTADVIPVVISALLYFEQSFTDLSIAERCERVREFSAGNPDLFQSLLTRVYDCYYQNDRVRAQIGVVSGAPFPQGNSIASGDLSLLDPVVANSARHTYRNA